VFNDSFENGLNNWTQGGQNDWQTSRRQSSNGSWSAEVDGKASDSYMTSPVIDLSGKTNARISFDWYISRSLDWGEYIAVDVSTDGGDTWTEIDRLQGFFDNENVWQSVEMNETDVSTIRLRFRGTMSRSNEDAYVDNVSVVAY